MPAHNVSLQTHWTFAELNEAHPLSLSPTTGPTLQALSLCLFLSNSHSLFTFAFLHCGSRQNNITPDPPETDCQAFIQSSYVHKPAFNVCIIQQKW